MSHSNSRRENEVGDGQAFSILHLHGNQPTGSANLRDCSKNQHPEIIFCTLTGKPSLLQAMQLGNTCRKYGVHLNSLTCFSNCTYLLQL